MKEWRNGVKLVWSESRIDDAIDELRCEVRDFHTISTQTIKLIPARVVDPNATSQAHQDDSNPSHTVEDTESVKMFRRIQQASAELYSALEKHWLCRTHDSHRVNICSAKRPNDGCISLEAVLTVYGNGETNESICVEVESVNQTDDMNTVSTKSVMTSSSKSSKGIADDCGPTQVIASPSSSTDAAPGRRDPTFELRFLKSAQPMATNLIQIQDFCLHFQRQYETMQPGKNLLGYLSDPSEQRFYSLGHERRVCGLPHSLAELVSSDNMLRPLSPFESMRIAASLATSVLQFYSTPWLPSDWSSKNVTFFKGQSYVTDIFNTLHFSIQLEQKVDKGKDTERGGAISTTSFGGSSARNELLFRLGVVLLETGLARSWASMRQAAIDSGRVQEGADECNIADFLAHTDLLRQMGAQYATIVQKCLGCDFGLGVNDFNSEMLQAVFHRDIVHGLRALYGRMASIWQ